MVKIPVLNNITNVGNITNTITTTQTSPVTQTPIENTSSTLHVLIGIISNPVIRGIIIALIIVAFLYFLYYRKNTGQGFSIGGKNKSYLAQRLAYAEEHGDIVGLVADANTKLIDFVPLRQKRGLYVSQDPDHMLLAMKNPKTSNYVIPHSGKPFTTIITDGDIMGMEIDPVEMTKLGIASLIPIIEKESESEQPEQDLKKIFSKLLAYSGKEIQGEIPLSDKLKIGFTMHVPNILKSYVQNVLQMSNMFVVHMVDINTMLDQIAIKLKQAQTEYTRARAWSYVAIAIGIAIAIAIVVSVFSGWKPSFFK